MKLIVLNETGHQVGAEESMLVFDQVRGVYDLKNVQKFKWRFWIESVLIIENFLTHNLTGLDVIKKKLLCEPEKEMDRQNEEPHRWQFSQTETAHSYGDSLP